MNVIPTEPEKPFHKKVLLLGEAPGEEEELVGKPFVGPSGRLLKKDLLPSAGLDFDTLYVANVFIQRIPNNDIKNWTATKTDLKKAKEPIIEPPLNKRYLLQPYWEQIKILQDWILSERFDLIICLGGTALWAMTGDSRIGTFRGSFINTRFGKVIGTYHPAAVQREWSFRPFVWADLKKAKGYIDETLTPPLRRKLYINPTWSEMASVYAAFEKDPTQQIGVDIETAPGIDQITVVGFATPTLGICIPIWDKFTGTNVYSNPRDEVRAWRWIEKFAKLPNPKAMQNGMYDMQYLLDAPIQIRVRNNADDTAILQHALQPELKKDLGTLASLYLNEPSWKQLRTSAKDAKKDD